MGLPIIPRCPSTSPWKLSILTPLTPLTWCSGKSMNKPFFKFTGANNYRQHSLLTGIIAHKWSTNTKILHPFLINAVLSKPANLKPHKSSFKSFNSVILSINVTWRDRRLYFLNLRSDIFDNVLPDAARGAIWVPDIGELINWYCEIQSFIRYLDR